MAYLLDTVTLSEVTKARAHPAVIAWIDSVDGEALYLSVLTIGEVRCGIAIRRRRDPVAAERLERWLGAQQEWFGDRVLPVDAVVAARWGALNAASTVATVDGLIAATALVHDLVIVTRNIRDFARTGVRLLDPWTDGAKR